MKTFALALLMFSASCFAADLTTLRGQTYQNVRITAVDPDGLRITHSSGVCKVSFADLPEEIRRQYGYDPAKAQAFINAQNAAMKARQQSIRNALVARPLLPAAPLQPSPTPQTNSPVTPTPIKTVSQPTVNTNAPAATSSLPAATKEQPWTNSLGMKFVPVPATTVLFSIWETRAQDYEAFTNATHRPWPRPKARLGPTHPADFLSWEDAKAFCKWLTEKEHQEGRISAQQTYRLPTDVEWSAAVGLTSETGSRPNEKSSKIKGVYPWGTKWPPPKGVGNYSPSLRVDNFAETAPVGSFNPNPYGLYDLSGNVWEWCEEEEEFAGQRGFHVVRGGSWRSGFLGSEELLSSYRSAGPPGQFIYSPSTAPSSLVWAGDYGFRAVLTAGGGSLDR